MPRIERAKQFAPFDTLKGLHEALKLKEYEHDRIEKGDLPEEKIMEISNILRSLKKDDKVKVLYFRDGHNHIAKGNFKIDYAFQTITIDKNIINFDDIADISIL